MQIYLKVKIKSLAAEAKIIRGLERKLNTNSRGRKRMARDLQFNEIRSADGRESEDMSEAQKLRIQKKLERSRRAAANPEAVKRRSGLQQHRRVKLRKQARSSFLAYGFIRGLEYGQIEFNARTSPDWKEVERLITKFSEEGSQTWRDRFTMFKIISGFIPKE